MLMLETPHLTQAEEQPAAVIHFTIPRSEIQAVMGPGFQELIATVTAQGIGPAGAFFSHHFTMYPDKFDFELGVPVNRPVAPSGRVKPGIRPGGLVARTVYRGKYEGLHAAWEEFMEWIKAGGHGRATDLWEVYVKGPESSPDPANWRTELNQPLLG
jgi:effector-binding domain-containing protein